MEESLSIVLPAHNEEHNLRHYLPALVAQLQGLSAAQVLVVDDASADGTYEYVRNCGLSTAAIAVDAIRLECNCGQSGALRVGIEAATGDWLMPLDADGQIPAEEVTRMLRYHGQLPDYCIKAKRRTRSVGLLHKIATKAGNAFLRWVGGANVDDFGCTAGMMPTVLLRNIPTIDVHIHRYLPYLIAAQGGKFQQVAVHEVERQYGDSHYTLAKSLGMPFEAFKVLRMVKSSEFTDRNTARDIERVRSTIAASTMDVK